MASCSRERELEAYHDGQLEREARRDIECHIERCPHCARELAQLRRLSGVIKAAPMPAMPAGTLDLLYGRLDAARQQDVLRLGELLAAAALVICLASLAALWGMGRGNAPEVAFGQEWERAAVTLRVEDAALDEPEIQLAQGLFTSLRPENGNE